MKKFVFSFLVAIIFFLSCNKDDERTTAIDTFHQKYYDSNILPAISDFKIEIEKQITLTEVFKEAQTLDNFKKLQEQWLISAKSFSKTRAYNLVAVKAIFFDTLIYNFPTTAETIDSNINNQAIYDTDYFMGESTVSKGLGALEYLLYNNQDSEIAYNLLQNDIYRINYLLGASKEILRLTNLLIDFWEQGYKETFINATSISCADNARCLAFNQLINILDVIRVTKVGKPSGLENSTGTSLETLEAFRSKSSLSLIRSTIEEVEKAYTLSTVNFASIVDEIAESPDVSVAIDNSFYSVYTYIDAIDTSLYDAIENDNPNVELMYDALFDLVKYFSVDAASILSVTVLPTDNDGD